MNRGGGLTGSGSTNTHSRPEETALSSGIACNMRSLAGCWYRSISSRETSAGFSRSDGRGWRRFSQPVTSRGETQPGFLQHLFRNIAPACQADKKRIQPRAVRLVNLVESRDVPFLKPPDQCKLLGAIAADIGAVMKRVPQLPEFASSPDLRVALYTSGIGESMVPAILGFTVLSLVWLLAAVGFRRQL